MVDLLVSYLDMNSPPPGDPLPAPVPGAAVQRERIGVDAYLELYRAVGGSFDWDRRLRMPRGELGALLALPSTWIYVLRIAGLPAGLCEFNRAGEPVVELAHFGLGQPFYGKRLGPYLLDLSLRSVWRLEPERVWLHTDTNDHPKALSVYLRAGFELRERRMETFPD